MIEIITSSPNSTHFYLYDPSTSVSGKTVTMYQAIMLKQRTSSSQGIFYESNNHRALGHRPRVTRK